MEISASHGMSLYPHVSHGEAGQAANAPEDETSGKTAEAEARGEKKEVTAREAAADISTPEYKQVQELKLRDREVRQHEQAHLGAAGQYALGGPSYEYQRGADGRNYAVGGEVQIDTARVPGDPEATVTKMQTVQAAALAPAEPSQQDRAVALEAAKMAAEARVELQRERVEGKEEELEAKQEEDGSQQNRVSKVYESGSGVQGQDALVDVSV